jgi:hypothetical protein
MISIAEYLERAHQRERMAAEVSSPELKDQLEKQALAYHKLAEERARKTGPGCRTSAGIQTETSAALSVQDDNGRAQRVLSARSSEHH